MNGGAENIGFSALVAQLAGGYASRPAAEAAIANAAGGPGGGCVLVCGEPGSGKSALAAHFIQTNRWCCHFLRIGHTEFTLWRDPYAFLTSLAFQLLAAYGEVIFPESVAIDVNGTVKDVTKTGTVVGVDVERLVALPWRRERLKVDLDAKGIAGEVTGIRIGELIENYRSVPLGAFRELAWFEPLRRLRALHPATRVTVWIDGLDEDSGAASGVSEADRQRRLDSISSLLPLASECRQLGNLTVVISSRPGPHLDRFTADGATRIDLADPSLADDTGAALHFLIQRELADPRTAAALTPLHWAPDEVRKALAGQSEGNFLFVRQYFEALRAGYGPALREGGLPQGLDEIHTRILSALVRNLPDNDRPPLLALLEVLAVAEAPLSLPQLARFAAIPEPTVNGTVSRLRPLLDETVDESPPRFSCYHKSLRDCLLDSRHATAAWHVEPARAHRRIAAAYFTADGGASGVDGYGLLHGATHLAHAPPDGPDVLLALLHDGWRRFCREVTGSNRVFRAGLELARAHASTLPPAEACTRLVRLGLADVHVRNAESAIPEAALEAMVRLGQVQRALEIAPDEGDPVRFARRHAAIIRGLLGRADGDTGLAARLLEQSVRQLRLRPEWVEPEIASVLEAWPLEKAAALRDSLPRVESALTSPPAGGARALAALARIRMVLEPPTANALFGQALDGALRNGIADAAYIVGRVLADWGRLDAPAAREHLQRHGSFPTTRSSAGGFMELAVALEQQGSPGAAVHHANLLLGVPLQAGRDPLEIAGIWLQVLAKAPAICSPATAAQIVDRVQEVLAKARAARLAGAKPAPASTTEMALRVDLTAAECRCRRSRDADALADAWQELLGGAAIEDEDLGVLLRQQASVDAELLEAYLNSAPAELQDRLWFAVLRESLLPESPGPQKALQRVTIATEKPRPTGWSTFFYALAETAPPDQLDRSEQLLREIGVHASLIVRWRLTILRRLVAHQHPRTGEWLQRTLHLWAGGGANRNFVDELPAAVADLPGEMVAVIAALVPDVPSRKQRQLLRAAIASARWARDPAAARSEFEALLVEPEDAGDPLDLGAYVVGAFVAGQLWPHDSDRAAQVWASAVARLEAASPSKAGRYVHQCAMLRALHWGAPAEAVRELRALVMPPPEPGVRMLMIPFPSVSPFRVANLPEHEFLLGAALLHAAPRHQALVRDALAGPLSAGARAYAFPELARVLTAVPLPQRLAWCHEAVRAAEQIEPAPLRCLLLAANSVATVDIGAKRRGLELAQRVVDAMTPLLGHGDTVIAHTLGAALGRCVAAAIICEAWASAWEWLWRGRALGMHGFYALLAELPAALQRVCPVSIEQFEAAEAAGRNLYV